MSGESEVARAVQYAYKLLGYRQRSIRELGERLKIKGFGERSVCEAIERLRGLGYLDDSAFARSLRKKAEDVKLLGNTGARHYLRRMGIPGETVDDALEGYDEAVSARRLLNRKLSALKRLPDAVARRRLLGYLKRRGYSFDTVRRSLADINNIKEEDL
jgi:regulatory protein